MTDTTCPVCLELFLDPKSLSCGHSICTECSLKISVFENGIRSFVCPRCRTVTKLSQNQTELPTNYDLKSIVAEISENSAGNETCGKCEKSTKRAQLWACVDCKTEEKICSDCALQNHNGHNLIKFETLFGRKEDLLRIMKTRKEKCQIEMEKQRSEAAKNALQTDRKISQKIHVVKENYNQLAEEVKQANLLTFASSILEFSDKVDKIDKKIQGPILTESDTIFGEKIVLIGGDPTVSALELYHPDKVYGSISREIYYYPAVCHCVHCSCSHDGQIFVTGGKSGDSILKSTKIFNPFTKQWSLGPDLTTGRVFASSAKAGNRWYICGGQNDQENLEKSCEMFEFEKQEWLNAPELPEARSVAAAAELEGKIYLFGGFLHSKNSANITDTVVVFDSAAQSWLSSTPLLRKRGSLAALAVDSSIYIVGGALEGEIATKSCERYDPRVGHSMLIGQMNCGRANHALTYFNGRLLALGGIGAERQATDNVEEYEDRMDKWVQREKMFGKKCFFTAQII